MMLTILLPHKTLLIEEVTDVVAETETGVVQLGPRDIEYVGLLVPGLLEFRTRSGFEEHVAVDRGTLLKCGPNIVVTTRAAARGPQLVRLHGDPEAAWAPDARPALTSGRRGGGRCRELFFNDEFTPASSAGRCEALRQGGRHAAQSE